MLLNFVKIAWRNLQKNKAYSFINIFGLASGLACCMLITVYLVHELSYDSYQPHAKDIYQVGSVFINNHQETVAATSPAPLGKTLKKDFPQVEAYTHFFSLSFFEAKNLMQYKPSNGTPLSFYEEKGFMADSNFFRMFAYNFIEGEPATALDQPNSIVLSEEIARKIFGGASALNKQIYVSSGVNGNYNFTVRGVYRPIDKPSHIDARFFLSFAGGGMESFMRSQDNDFATNNMFDTYVRLRPGSNPALLEAQFPAFLDKYAGKDLKAMGFDKRQYLVPLQDIHLRSDITLTVTPPASKTYLYILASIAVFTLLIACINFMNLATARSAKRSSEVGVRKVLGAVKASLIGQFLGESVLMGVFAFFFAWAITLLLLPVFGKIVDRHLSLGLPENLTLVLGFLGLALFAGLLAGLYPALYLSSFQPAKVLKGKFSNSLAAISLRKGLVVFQFIISVMLIISTVVFNDQMGYLRSKDLGFEKSAQIVVPLRGEQAKELRTALANEFRRDGRVISVGASNFYPGIVNPADNMLYRDDKTVNDAKRTRMNFVDYDYLTTLGNKAVAGRLFGKEFPGDTSGRIILNETAVKELGFASSQAAIGRKVRNNFRGAVQTYEIVGVVKDFHFEDLHLPITPYTFLLTKNANNYIIVHARPGAPGPLLSSLGAAWHTINPTEPFEYSFLEEDFQKNYAADERLSAMIRYFTTMAILISCLGLFGLASFSAEQRIREIGIRKVLGASVMGIVLLLSKDFLKLVGIAVLIASPLAWWIMHRWLQDFAYRTTISWVVFVVTVLATLLITLFTISFQAIRASLTNPVKSLKSE